PDAGFLLRGASALGHQFVGAPGVHEVLDVGPVIDRQWGEPSLRDERDGVVSGDRQAVLPAGWERTRAGLGPGHGDHRQHDPQSPCPASKTHENSPWLIGHAASRIRCRLALLASEATLDGLANAIPETLRHGVDLLGRELAIVVLVEPAERVLEPLGD